jgi:CRP-like cAMP-binding protein
VSRDLDRFALLAALCEAERDALGRYLEERRFAAGAQLFDCGEESHELLLVLEGRVRLARGGRELGLVGAGETLGGLGLTRVGQRACAAHAAEAVRALALDRAAYHRLRVDAPATALSLQEAVARDFASAVAEALAALEGAAFDDAPEVDAESGSH